MAKFKIKDIVAGAEQLSLGIFNRSCDLAWHWARLSCKKGYKFHASTLDSFAIGIAAAILNVYKAYKAQVKSLDELKDETRYKGYKKDDDDEDD